MAIKEYIREKFFPHIWCPGCGHGIALNGLLHAVENMGLKKMTAQMTPDQAAARATFERLGFRAEALLADYSAEHQTPAERGTVMKCDFCPDMARAGRLPFCAQGCPNYAIYYGDLEEDVATNGRDVVVLSRLLAESNTYRLKEELGTEPRVHYIPGHGELVGRKATTKGRLPTRWPWTKLVKGATTWTR